MEPVLLGQRQHIDLCDGHVLQAEPPGIALDHEEDRRIIENGGDGGHDQYLEVRDLEDLRDQKRGGAENGGREDGAYAARCQQPSGRVFVVAGSLQKRPGYRAEGDGGGGAASRHRSEEKGCQGDGAAGPGPALSHTAEREIDKKLARPGQFQNGAEDGEEDDKGGGDLHGCTEKAVQGHILEGDNAGHGVTPVAERLGQERAPVRVCDANQDHKGKGKTRGPARGFEHQETREHAERDVEGLRICHAIDEGFKIDERVGESHEHQQRQDHVEDDGAAFPAPGGGIVEKGKDQDHHYMTEPDDLSHHGAESAVEGKQGTEHGYRGGDVPQGAAEFARRGLELLEDLLRPLRGHGFQVFLLAHAPSSHALYTKPMD